MKYAMFGMVAIGMGVLLLSLSSSIMASAQPAQVSSAPAPPVTNGDPFYGLPGAPPLLTNVALQGLVDDLFRYRSNCWAVNNWARVSVAGLIKTLDAALINANKTTQKALAKKFAADYQNTLGQLGACPINAWVTDATGTKYLVTQFAAQSTIPTSVQVKLA
jgi:hypothetical protein